MHLKTCCLQTFSEALKCQKHTKIFKNRVQKLCFLPPKLVFIKVHFKILGLNNILGLKKIYGLKKVLSKKMFEAKVFGPKKIWGLN